jgi:hypothetical protein
MEHLRFVFCMSRNLVISVENHYKNSTEKRNFTDNSLIFNAEKLKVFDEELSRWKKMKNIFALSNDIRVECLFRIQLNKNSKTKYDKKREQRKRFLRWFLFFLFLHKVFVRFFKCFTFFLVLFEGKKNLNLFPIFVHQLFFVLFLLLATEKERV